jgi:hypothetical protein
MESQRGKEAGGWEKWGGGERGRVGIGKRGSGVEERREGKGCLVEGKD